MILDPWTELRLVEIAIGFAVFATALVIFCTPTKRTPR